MVTNPDYTGDWRTICTAWNAVSPGQQRPHGDEYCHAA